MLLVILYIYIYINNFTILKYFQHAKYHMLHIQQMPPDEEYLLYSKHLEGRLLEKN